MRASWSVRRMAWRPSVFSLPDCRVDDLWPRLGLLLVLLRRLVTAGSGRGALPGRIGRRGGTAVFGPAARCRPVRTGDHQVGTPGRLCNVRPDLPVPIGTARRAPPDDVTGPAGGGKAGAGSRAHRGSGEAGSRAHGTPFTPGACSHVRVTHLGSVVCRRRSVGRRRAVPPASPSRLRYAKELPPQMGPGSSVSGTFCCRAACRHRVAARANGFGVEPAPDPITAAVPDAPAPACTSTGFQSCRPARSPSGPGMVRQVRAAPG